MARQKPCFIAFPIMPLTESFNNGQKLSGETHIFSKGVLSASQRREVKYPVSPLDFLEKSDLLSVLSSLLLPLPSTSASSAMSDGEYLADLVVELVPLPTLTSSAMSLTLTSSSLIWL